MLLEEAFCLHSTAARARRVFDRFCRDRGWASGNNMIGAHFPQRFGRACAMEWADEEAERVVRRCERLCGCRPCGGLMLLPIVVTAGVMIWMHFM
mmetsp:Transcript_12850/g.40625  ORF Transcript_12850/g.40625 Transcript_12850/m.40625 type:complete len:95 (-) Transcript_12850:310-594(-)